jgi:hypothetical protein
VISKHPSEAMAFTAKHAPLVESVLLLNKTEADDLVAVSEKSLLKFRPRFMREGWPGQTNSSTNCQIFPDKNSGNRRLPHKMCSP